MKIYEPTWSVFVKGGDVYIIAFCCFSIIWMVLSSGHLAGSSPFLARKLSWDWMSITGWRQFRHWTHCPSALARRTRCTTRLFRPSCSTPSALVYAPSRKVISVLLLSTSGRCCQDVVFTGMYDFLVSRFGTWVDHYTDLFWCKCVLLCSVCCKVPSK